MVSENMVLFVYLCYIYVENCIRLHQNCKLCNELGEKYQKMVLNMNIQNMIQYFITNK